MPEYARVTVESEEEGFLLRVDAGAHQALLLIEDPEELFDSVRSQIGPWLREKAEARGEFNRQREEAAAYELNDPKHPRHHEVYADTGPVLGRCPHGVDLDREFCAEGCRV
jgi:hypothetical protein